MTKYSWMSNGEFKNLLDRTSPMDDDMRKESSIRISSLLEENRMLEASLEELS